MLANPNTGLTLMIFLRLKILRESSCAVKRIKFPMLTEIRISSGKTRSPFFPRYRHCHHSARLKHEPFLSNVRLFPKMGIPQARWMVYFMENPKLNGCFRGTPISGNANIKQHQ
jgi:hypothetical protein